MRPEEKYSSCGAQSQTKKVIFVKNKFAVMKISLKRYQRALLALLSVLLLSLGWLRVSGLVLLVAFVPLMLISASYDAGRKEWWRMAGWVALVMGLWCVATCWWIYYAAAVGIVAATIIQVVLFGGVFMIYHSFSHHARPVVAYTTLIAGWLWAEHLYLNGEVSFPWLLLGNGFAGDVWAVQWYELTGVLGGSLWVLLTNILLFEWILNRKNRAKGVAVAVVAVIPMVASLIIGGLYKENPNAPKATVTLVQPNIDPYEEKYTMPIGAQMSILSSLISEAPEGVDYIVLPETVIGDAGDPIWESNHLGSFSMRSLESLRAKRYPEAQLIMGAMTYHRYNSEREASQTARRSGSMIYDRYNAALALDRDSTLKVSHKSRLVVGVEKMPFMDVLKPLEKLIVDLGGTTGQLGTDKYRHLLHQRNNHFPYGISVAAPICYESVYGEHFGGFAADGAELMMVITNDGWWHDTEGYRQHFSFSRLRAIESRRWVCRAANTGISGFISPDGRVHETLGWDKCGTLTAEVTPSREVTFYAKAGDYLGRIGTYLFILSLLYYVSYRFRHRNHLV